VARLRQRDVEEGDEGRYLFHPHDQAGLRAYLAATAGRARQAMGAGTILVVDDDVAITTLLRDAFEDAGYTVATAVGAAMLEMARAVRPDLILLDIVMPEIDGAELSRLLSADPLTRDIPLIAVSGLGASTLAWVTMPVDERLPKPFDLDRLLTLVARVAAAH